MKKDELTEDEYADELARFQQRLESGRSDDERPLTGSSPENCSDELASAKRVIELLAKVRPQPSHQIDTRTDSRRTLDTPVNAVDQHSSTQIPTKVGRFEIKSLVGQGGFGIVFLAYDPQLSRDVALKIPQLSALLDTDAQERFRREGRALATLSHPGIIPVFEVGSDGPIAYIASQFVTGVNLAELIERDGPVDGDLAARITLDLAKAISHAHQRGVIHRDLKPANVLMETTRQAASEDTDQGQQSSPNRIPDSQLEQAGVRVADFGLAKLLADADKQVTRTGSVLGTPAFAAPEQLQSNDQHTDTTSADIYSIGALLYYLTVGTAPFDTQNMAVTIQNVVNETPVPPHVRSGAVSADLSAIAMKCLHKSPVDRYPTVDALGIDLQRFLNKEAVAARPLSRYQQAWRWCVQNRLVASLTVGTAVAIFFGAVASVLSARSAARSKLAMSAQYQASKQTIDDYFVSVSEDPVFKSGAFQSTRRRLLESALVHYQTLLDENKDGDALVTETARIQLRLGDASFDMGDNARAKELYSDAERAAVAWLEQAEIADAQKQELLLLSAMCNARLANVALAADEIGVARTLSTKAIGALTLLHDQDKQDVEILSELSGAYLKQSEGYLNENDYTTAEIVCGEHRQVLESADSRQPLTASLRNQLAMAIGTQARIASRMNTNNPRELFDKSIAISSAIIEQNPSVLSFVEVVANTLNSRARILANQGELEEAEADLVTAVGMLDGLSIINKTPEFQSLRINATNNLASCLSWRSKSSEALSTLGQVVELSRELAADNPDTPEYQRQLIHAIHGHSSELAQRFQIEESRVLAIEVRKMLDETALAPDVEFMQGLSSFNLSVLGKLAHSEHKFSVAKTYYDKAVAILEALLEKRPEDPGLKSSLGVVLEGRAFTLPELGLFDLAVKDRRRVLGLDGMSGDMQRLFLADALVRHGSVDEAREIVEAVVKELAQKESISVGLHIQLSFVLAGLAMSSEPQGKQQESDFQSAEEHFQLAVSDGYFTKEPSRIHIFGIRKDLEPFFNRPPVRSVLDAQRATGE